MISIVASMWNDLSTAQRLHSCDAKNAFLKTILTKKSEHEHSPICTLLFDDSIQLCWGERELLLNSFVNVLIAKERYLCANGVFKIFITKILVRGNYFFMGPIRVLHTMARRC